MEKWDLIVGIIIGVVALGAIAGVIYLAFAGKEALHTGNKLLNAGLILWIADHLLSTILAIVMLSVALWGVIVYLMHFGLK